MGPRSAVGTLTLGPWEGSSHSVPCPGQLPGQGRRPAGFPITGAAPTSLSSARRLPLPPEPGQSLPSPRVHSRYCLDHHGSLLTVSLLQAALLRLFTTHGLTLANLGSLRLRPHSQPLPSPLWTPISQLP